MIKFLKKFDNKENRIKKVEVFNEAILKFNKMYDEMDNVEVNEIECKVIYNYGKNFLKNFKEFNCYDLHTVENRLRLLKDFCSTLSIDDLSVKI